MNKSYLKAGFIILAVISVFSGCTSYKIQNAVIDGAPNRNAIKITEDRKQYSMVANTFLSFNDKRTLSANIDEHTKVNSKGVYQLDPVDGQTYFKEPDKVNIYDFSGNNFLWNMPSAVGAFEVDFAVLKNISLWGGLNYSSVNSRSIFGKKFGIGFYTHSEHTASRFDIGYRFQDFYYNVEYLEIYDAFNEQRIYYHTQKKTETVSNLDFSFTFNTLNKPLDFFLNLTLGNQTYFSFSPDGSILSTIEHSSFCAGISFGVFKKVSDESRILVGARYSAYQETGKTSLSDFFIQYDFIMF